MALRSGLARWHAAVVLRVAVAVALTTVAATGVALAPAAAPGVASRAADGDGRDAHDTVASAYAPPLDPVRVVRAFDRGTTRYGPGHRGVDLAAADGAPVRAAGAGEVTFAGPVAGRSLVVVLHPDGIRTEYEPVTPLERVGRTVAAGEVIGRVSGRHRGCPEVCLHWGARRGEAYLDPLSLLAPLGPVRLLPWSATTAAGWGYIGRRGDS